MSADSFDYPDPSAPIDEWRAFRTKVEQFPADCEGANDALKEANYRIAILLGPVQVVASSLPSSM